LSDVTPISELFERGASRGYVLLSELQDLYDPLTQPDTWVEDTAQSARDLGMQVLDDLVEEYPDQVIERSEGYFRTPDGEDIWFETAGSGPPLVLAHGLGGNGIVWFQQVPYFAGHYRVIIWDQRGFGRSSNHTGRAGPRTSIADQLALLDHLGVETAHLVGQSLGGWVVLGAAVTDRLAYRIDMTRQG
jgi:pimeloyl-ACP methyl ester carboxylesterase